MNVTIVNQLGLRLLHQNSSKISILMLCKALINADFTRQRHTKHWLPKWKPLRRLKVMKVQLPDFQEDPEDLTEDEIRAKLKEQGLVPPRPWVEKPYFVSSTGGVFEAYVPPEGDGKVSRVSAQGAKQTLQFLEKKTKSMMAIRKVKSFDEDFETANFCAQAEKIYIKMHELMSKKDLDRIVDYVTERAYPEIIHNIQNKTIHWKFIKNIEPPRVVHARCTHVITQENIFAQITIRFHTQQSLAVYDRFGRLMHGSEILAKDVLEYVVFEKHLANEYGIWRVHAKIIPDWLPPKDPSPITYKKKPPPKIKSVATVEENAPQISNATT